MSFLRRFTLGSHALSMAMALMSNPQAHHQKRRSSETGDKPLTDDDLMQGKPPTQSGSDRRGCAALEAREGQRHARHAWFSIYCRRISLARSTTLPVGSCGGTWLLEPSDTQVDILC